MVTIWTFRLQMQNLPIMPALLFSGQNYAGIIGTCLTMATPQAGTQPQGTVNGQLQFSGSNAISSWLLQLCLWSHSAWELQQNGHLYILSSFAIQHSLSS